MKKWLAFIFQQFWLRRERKREYLQTSLKTLNPNSNGNPITIFLAISKISPGVRNSFGILFMTPAAVWVPWWNTSPMKLHEVLRIENDRTHRKKMEQMNRIVTVSIAKCAKSSDQSKKRNDYLLLLVFFDDEEEIVEKDKGSVNIWYFNWNLSLIFILNFQIATVYQKRVF